MPHSNCHALSQGRQLGNTNTPPTKPSSQHAQSPVAMMLIQPTQHPQNYTPIVATPNTNCTVPQPLHKLRLLPWRTRRTSLESCRPATMRLPQPVQSSGLGDRTETYTLNQHSCPLTSPHGKLKPPRQNLQRHSYTVVHCTTLQLCPS